ncbi:hypothetical protein Tco_1337865 [Tanacetum coccineum]
MAPKRATRSTRVPPVTPAPNATTTTVTEAQLQALINQGVAAAMAEAEASRVRNGYDSNGSVPRPAQAARACSYSEFLKCKPLDFKGIEGVTTTPKVAHAMPWAALKKMMTDKYCPRGEIKKIETEMWNLKNNKSIDRSVQQKNLYKALVDTYESEKDILATYGDTVTLKRCLDDEDEDEEPSTGSNRGSKRRRAGKEPESTSAPKKKTSKSSGKSKEGSKSHQKSTGRSTQAEEPIHADEELEEPAHQEFDTGFIEDQPVDETTKHPDWFQKPTKPPTPDRDWNKTLPAKHGPVQPWISTLARNKDPPSPTFELMKGSCKSLVELKYFLEEVCKAITDQLDWNNPEGLQYPHDMPKPLPLIPNSRTYATLVTKTKAADYGHIKWIEDLVPNTMWSQLPIVYNKHALWGISHWGRKRQQFYGYAANRESAHDVYSRNIIIGINMLTIVEWHNYKHLEWITVRRDDDKLYIFKEGDYNRLRLQDIEDMLLLLVHGKLTNINIEECLALGVSLRMFTRSIVLRRRMEDLQLAYSNPKGFICQNKEKKNRLMRIDELYKFSNGTLNDVWYALDDILKRIRMEYLP